FLLWDPFGVLVTQTPLADQASVIPNLLQHLCHSQVAGPERLCCIAAHPRMTCVQSSHQSAARRGADRAARVEIGEADAFGSQPIEVRRLDPALSVAAQITVPKVVGQNQNDARSPRRRRMK